MNPEVNIRDKKDILPNDKRTIFRYSKIWSGLRLCLDIIKSTERNGAERNGMERSGTERNEDTIPLFENFRTEQDKLFIPPKSKGKKNGGKGWNGMESIPLYSAPFHPFLNYPNNGISFYSIPFRSAP